MHIVTIEFGDRVQEYALFIDMNLPIQALNTLTVSELFDFFGEDEPPEGVSYSKTFEVDYEHELLLDVFGGTDEAKLTLLDCDGNVIETYYL
jgi:hypothetical protein